MKRMRNLLLNAVLVVVFPVCGFAKPVNCTDGNSVQLNGDSTVRKFSSLSSKVKVEGAADPVPANAVYPWTPTAIDISIDVKTLKSDSTTLDDHMYESLKADKFSSVKINLKKFRFENKTAIAEGTLTIAGVTNPVELRAVQETVDNKMNLKGSYTLQMTDFGIQPPTMMMGTIKTANKIDVVFNVSCSTTLQEENK
jgi:hypothetical protein